MKRHIIVAVTVAVTAPCILTFLLGTNEPLTPDDPFLSENNSAYSKSITVVNPETQVNNEMSMDEYIIGVVAAEMPVSFDTEALKAQAVAARTYALRRIEDYQINPESITKENIASIYQAYSSKDELKQKWGDNFSEYYSKIADAVNSTKGEIMVYDDIPIEAVFHSTSAGMTENSENVWQKEYPYLKSVQSQNDTLSPEYSTDTSFKTSVLLGILRDSFNGLYLTDSDFLRQFQIISRSGAGYVDTVLLGNLTVTGRQIREALGLKSSAFTVSQNGDTITFSTKGYGHGVGMSQYGANALAEIGYDYRGILEHYYTGIAIVSAY